MTDIFRGKGLKSERVLKNEINLSDWVKENTLSNEWDFNVSGNYIVMGKNQTKEMTTKLRLCLMCNSQH